MNKMKRVLIYLNMLKQNCMRAQRDVLFMAFDQPNVIRKRVVSAKSFSLH